MKFLKMFPIIFIFLGLPSYMNLSYAESKNTNEYKVLSNTNKKLSISDVKDYFEKGDNLVKNGDFEKANKIIKQLFIRDFKNITNLVAYTGDKKNSLDDIGKIFNQKNVFKGKTGIFEIKDKKIRHVLNFYKVEKGKFIKIF